jgi:hypothetical protein
MFGPADLESSRKIVYAARFYTVENAQGRKVGYTKAGLNFRTTSVAQIQKTVIDMRANGTAAELVSAAELEAVPRGGG